MAAALMMEMDGDEDGEITEGELVDAFLRQEVFTTLLVNKVRGDALNLSQELDQPTPRIAHVLTPGTCQRQPYTLKYVFIFIFNWRSSSWVLAFTWW
jgi:hypothetical protein